MTLNTGNGGGGSSSIPKKKKKKNQGPILGPFMPGTTNPNTGQKVPEYKPRSGSSGTPKSAPTPSYLQPFVTPQIRKPKPLPLPDFMSILQSIKESREGPKVISSTPDTLDVEPDPNSPWANLYSAHPKKAPVETGNAFEGALPKKKDLTPAKPNDLTDYLKQVADPNLKNQPGVKELLNKFGAINLASDLSGASGLLPSIPKKARSDAWNLRQIQSELSDATSDSNYAFLYNGLLERQFTDRENYLIGGGDTKGADNSGVLYRKSDKIVEVLKAAQDAVYEGDFDYLKNYMEKHPNFSLDTPSYKAEFGITPEDVWKQWVQDRKNLTPEQREDGRYRIDMIRRHLTKFREKYADTRRYVQDAIDRYETKYNDRLDKYENWSGEDADKNKALAAKAGPAIPDLTPATDPDDQAVMDAAGGGSILDIYKGTMSKRVIRRAERATYQADRKLAKDTLKIDRLPSIRDMLAVKVDEGNLDPEDQEAVNTWIKRFKNPNHPDTRAMYAAFARQYGGDEAKNLSDDEILKYINEPVVKYGKEQEKRAADYAAEQKEYDRTHTDDPLDFISDSIKRTGMLTPVDVRPTGQGHGGGGKQSFGEFADQTGLSWTIDKLARLNYGVAGWANKFYAIDQDRETAWHGQDGFLGFAINMVTDPLANITGQSWIDSVDEIAKNPGVLKDPAQEAYSQVFRGSNLPGVKDNITPYFFSHVIANNAARDPDNNIYDKEWYQHVAGFALDVGLDPLNFVGVGLVDDVVKLPVKAARALGEGTEGARRLTDFYKMVSAPNMSPIAEHVFRTNEALRRGGAYFPDAGVFGTTTRSIPNPVGRLSDEAVVAGDVTFQPFKQSVAELHAARTKFINDVGNDHLLSVVDDIDGAGSISQKVEDSLRVNRLEARLGNLGHDARTSLKTLAKAKGYQTNVAKAGKPEYLKADVERYLDEGGKLPNEYGTRAEYNKDAISPDPVGSYQPAPISKSLRQEYAASMGYKKEQFPFSERDIYESLVNGTRMLSKSDPVFRARYTEARARVTQSQKSLARATTAQQKDYARSGLDSALRDLRTDIYGASLRYLDTLGQLRRDGFVAFDEFKYSSLFNVRSKVRDQRIGVVDGSSNVGTKSDVDRLTSEAGLDESAFAKYNELTDEDLLNPAHEAFTNPRQFSGLDQGTHLRMMDQTLSKRIDALRLDKDGKLTGLPPREAYDVAQLIPPGLKNADGTIDAGRLKSVFVMHDNDWARKNKIPLGDKRIDNKIYYNLNGHKEHAEFAELMRGAIADEYRDAYVKLHDEFYAKNLEAEGGKTPVGSGAVEALGKKPERSDPIKPSKGFEGTPWSKSHPEGFSSPADLKQYALSSPESFYSALYEAGSPFKFKAYKRLDFKGKTPKFDEPSSLRKWAMTLGTRKEVDAYMRQVSDLNYAHMVDERVKIQTLDESAGEIRTKSGSGVGDKELTQKFHETWNTTVKAREAKWQSEFTKAQKKDQYTAKSVDQRKGALSPEQKANLRRQAFRDARDVVVKSVVDNQKIPRTTGNERLTINETARAAEREIKSEFAWKKNDLELRISFASEQAQIKDLRAQLGSLVTAKNEALRAIEKGRVEAHETRKVMKNRLDEELYLQVASAPEKISVKAMQFRIAGMKKNLQFPNGMFDSMKTMERLLPPTVYEKFANTWVRPSKTLRTTEAITFRAMIESKTPVVIHAHLSRMSKRMGKIETANRVAMFEAARRGRDYVGPQSGLFKGVKDEMDELLQVFKGDHPFYKFRDVNYRETPLSIHDINAYLTADNKMDVIALQRTVRGKRSGITLDDVFENIKKVNPKADINDPFVFAWKMRLAMDQAQQTKAVQNLIRETFGVKRIGEVIYKDGKQVFKRTPNSDRGALIEKLKDKNWQTVEELGGAHYFPPEAVNDIRQLLKFMNPELDKAGIMKQFDTILGYWKQGVTIYNPGYYSRNGIGEVMSSWLDGVSNPKYYRQSMKVMRYMKNNDIDLADLIEKFALTDVKAQVTKSNEVVTTLRGGQKITVEDVLQQYIQHGLKSTFANTDIGQGLRGLASSAKHDKGLRKAGSAVNEKVHAAGEGFEDYLRMAHFIHALENSGKTKIEHAAEYAAQRVRKYHFDYTDFSKFEQTVMLRAFPFYKWTRRGAPLMLAHLFLTPGKMSVLPKAMNTLSNMGPNPEQLMPWNWNDDDPLFSTKDVYEDTNGFLPNYRGIAPAWVRDLFAYEMNPTEDDEYANYFRVQTPMIDGLNAALINPTDIGGTWSQPLEQAALPLLNPLIKMPIELGINRSLDPDGYQIYGGAYNEGNQINNAEAIGSYIARNAQPLAGLLAKMSKNGDLGPLSMGIGGYRDEHGYEKGKDIASFLTGLGFYQGMPDDEPAKVEGTKDTTPVGMKKVSDIPMFEGASPPERSGKTEADTVKEAIASILQGGGLSNGGGYSGSGWKNFGYGGYRHYGGGGYGGGSGGGFDLMEFLAQLAKQIDQGQIYKGELDD